MPYCPRCGVEVEDRLDKCPLCDTAIPDEVRDSGLKDAAYPMDLVAPRKMYRSLSAAQRKRLIISLMILVGLIPVLLTTALDLLQNRRITWSYYVILSILGASSIASLFIRLPHRPMISVNGTMFILVAIYMLFREPLFSLFIVSNDLHVIAAFVASAECILVFLCTAKRIWYRIVSFALLISGIFLITLDYILSGTVGWSLVVSSSLLPAAVYVFYLGKAKFKGLNAVGLFFLLLTLMLLSLDFSTGFSGWSLITSVVFGFLTSAFYIMHLVLSKEIDWKKALHL